MWQMSVYSPKGGKVESIEPLLVSRLLSSPLLKSCFAYDLEMFYLVSEE